MGPGDLKRISRFVQDSKKDNNPFANITTGGNNALTSHQNLYLEDFFVGLGQHLDFENDPVREVAKLEDKGTILEGEFNGATYRFKIEPADTQICVYDENKEIYCLDEMQIQSNDPDPEEAYNQVLEKF